MVPKAKKNLHACYYHLNNLCCSKHFEEVEINFAAFVNSARNTTFVLQKQFKRNLAFITWYGDPDPSKEAIQGTKHYEMKNDALCKFFNALRSQIAKEGINNLKCLTRIRSKNATTDFPDKPVDASLAIGPQGIYYHVHEGTAKEDYIPAMSKTAEVIMSISIKDAPKSHKGKTIENPNLFTISQLYYKYLESLVEEWTGIVNSLG